MKSPLMPRLMYSITRGLAMRQVKRHDDGVLSACIERYSVIRSRFLTIYIHRFLGADQTGTMHDHPWHSASVVLAGSYTEGRFSKDAEVSYRKIRWFNFTKASTFHQVTRAEPETWAVFVHLKKIKDCGFLSDISSEQANYRVATEMEQDWSEGVKTEEREPLKFVI